MFFLFFRQRVLRHERPNYMPVMSLIVRTLDPRDPVSGFFANWSHHQESSGQGFVSRIKMWC